MSTAASSTESAVPPDGDDYESFLVVLRDHFGATTVNAPPLFTTDATGLFDLFLSTLPPERRQHYTCAACRRFLDKYGSLVCVRPGDGTKYSPLWDSGTANALPAGTPPFFSPALSAMSRAVAKANITGVFLTEEKVWGLPQNKTSKPPGIWTHMAVTPPRELVFKITPLQNASQRAAERLEEHPMLCRGLAEFPLEIVRQAHALLSSGNLYRSEKCIGVAKWLLDLHEARAAAPGRERSDNLTWLAVATAPAGFCHVKSGMIGTLLEDITAGLPFDDIKAKFDAKMHPLEYQRPQAPPAAGNIKHAEAIVGKLASAGALERRFARLDEIQTLWKPAAVEPPKKGGVFSHLKPKGERREPPKIEQPPVTMTWDKFARTVLPQAERVAYLVPQRNMSYAALVTAVNPDAPPILQWDRDDKRNPVSWYLYTSGSPPEAWNLKAGVYHRVTGIALQPSMWDGEDKYSHQGQAVFILLDGAKDTQKAGGRDPGGGLFPEHLKSEYHAIRSTMEAHAKSARIIGYEESSACGLKLHKGAAGTWDCVLRVTSKGGAELAYNLDRWD